MRIEEDVKLDFKDVLIRPKRSTLASRKEVDIRRPYKFKWSEREQHLQALFAEVPRVGGAQRIVLLHDPGAFQYIPEGEGELVLSGHTHGGQVGLVSFGHPLTAVSATSSVPDHGFWARGPDRLYVHRATGHYGFPLRMGVPGEEGVTYVHRVSPDRVSPDRVA